MGTVLAYLLIECEIGKIKSALSTIKKIKNIREVYSVAGPNDIIASVICKDVNELGRLVTSKIQPISGIKRTVTQIAVDL